MADLWDELAKETKAKYDEWFPRWSAAEQKERNARDKGYGEFSGAASAGYAHSAPTPTGHPLASGNPEAVSDWFSNDLGPSERAAVLATALFQGMNRIHLAGVAQDFAELLGLVVAADADEDGTLTITELDDGGRVIHIPAARPHRSAAAGAPPAGPADFGSFARTGMEIIEVSRNTEHGVTQVQSLGFATEAAREAALRLLNLPGLYDRLPQLYEYLRRMGCGADRERRYFAGLSVSVLARVLPFADLKQQIIQPWARTDDRPCRDSAGIALAETLAAEHCERDILALVKHWSHNANPTLSAVALTAFTWRFNPSRATEALAAIEATTDAPTLSLGVLFAVRELFRRIADAAPGMAIAALPRWIRTDQPASLRMLSALLALEFLRLDDAIETEETRAQAVEVIGALWDDPSLPLHAIIQQETTEMVKDWADRALDLWDKERPELFVVYRQLFQALGNRYGGQRRDRLRFHLERWDRQRDQDGERRRSKPRAGAIPDPARRRYGDLMTPG